jgi:hypothetical protein
MKLAFSLILLLSLYSCRRGNDANLLQKKDASREVSECNKFSFSDFSKEGLWAWHKSDAIKKADSSFVIKNMSRFPTLSYNPSYQTLYDYCDIGLPAGLVGKVIIQRMHNNSEARIFLLYGGQEETRFTGIFLLAQIQKSPDDMLYISSKFTDPAHIERTSVYLFSDDVESYKDSVITKFLLKDKLFIVEDRDSTRLDY